MLLQQSPTHTAQARVCTRMHSVTTVGLFIYAHIPYCRPTETRDTDNSVSLSTHKHTVPLRKAYDLHETYLGRVDKHAQIAQVDRSVFLHTIGHIALLNTDIWIFFPSVGMKLDTM